MIVELDLQQIPNRSEVEIPVYYKGFDIGKRYCDLIIDAKVILEIKAVFY